MHNFSLFAAQKKNWIQIFRLPASKYGFFDAADALEAFQMWNYMLLIAASA